MKNITWTIVTDIHELRGIFKLSKNNPQRLSSQKKKELVLGRSIKTVSMSKAGNLAQIRGLVLCLLIIPEGS